jgi:hypothetical protein
MRLTPILHVDRVHQRAPLVSAVDPGVAPALATHVATPVWIDEPRIQDKYGAQVVRIPGCLQQCRVVVQPQPLMRGGEGHNERLEATVRAYDPCRLSSWKLASINTYLHSILPSSPCETR